MNLIIDIGNTRTKATIFDGEKFLCTKTYNDFGIGDLESLRKDYPGLAKTILSTVKDYPIELKSKLAEEFKPLIELNHTTPLPIENKYKSKETLGNDRLAAVVGANYLYPATDLLVIDAGTAITYDFIDKNGHYLGGNISPGINMRFWALNRFTGRLPLVEPQKNDALFGETTEMAIRIGVQNGIIYEMEKTIEVFKVFYNNLQVIITGGDAHIFDKNLKSSFFVVLNLVGTGLNRILNYNGEV